MIKEKTFYKSFMVLALSLALQNLLTYGVNLMDTMMLGRYSQDAMGGVSLCNQVQFLLQMLVVGAGEGAVALRRCTGGADVRHCAVLPAPAAVAAVQLANGHRGR